MHKHQISCSKIKFDKISTKQSTVFGITIRVVLFILISTISLYAKPQTEPARIHPPKESNGISIPFVFGGGTPFTQTLNINNEDLSVSAGGGLSFGTGLYYALANNIKFGGTFHYQASEVKNGNNTGSVSFKRLILTPEMKFPIKLNDNSYLNIGGGYGFYFNGELQIKEAGVSKISGQANYNPENGVHLLTEYEEKFNDGSLSIGMKYYNVKYSQKTGDFNLNELFGNGLDLYITYSLQLN